MRYEMDLSRIDLNLLVLFEVVLEERHVGRAAERLNLSPSAVSHGLGRLRRLLNDPLFLRMPKGVVPTERATDLAEPIGDVLARVRSVVAMAEPFDPARCRRRITIGAPDAISAVFLSPLLAELHRSAPGIDISARNLLPRNMTWDSAFTDLDARAIDIAIVPYENIPARFVRRKLYEETFVIVMRAGHPLANALTLGLYCEALHLVVSTSGDSHGYVDVVLAERGLSRRIALTVPNFMLALALIAETDLVAALPERLVAIHAARFDVVSRPAPLTLRQFQINAIASRAAMMDAGLAWLFEQLERLVGVAASAWLPAGGGLRDLLDPRH